MGVHVDDVVGIVADPATGGYWLVGSNGSVWNFHAPDLSTLPSLGTSVGDFVGGASTPDGQGSTWWVPTARSSTSSGTAACRGTPRVSP